MSAERHVMADLPGVGWTCTCGDIYASSEQQDVFIHIEWALRAERDEARAALQDAVETIQAFHRARIERGDGEFESLRNLVIRLRAALSPSPPDSEEHSDA